MILYNFHQSVVVTTAARPEATALITVWLRCSASALRLFIYQQYGKSRFDLLYSARGEALWLPSVDALGATVINVARGHSTQRNVAFRTIAEHPVAFSWS